MKRWTLSVSLFFKRNISYNYEFYVGISFNFEGNSKNIPKQMKEKKKKKKKKDIFICKGLEQYIRLLYQG